MPNEEVAAMQNNANGRKIQPEIQAALECELAKQLKQFVSTSPNECLHELNQGE